MTKELPGADAIAVWRLENIERKQALGPGPAQARVLDLMVDRVRCRLLVPTDHPAGVLVYLHGGGWVIGSIDTFDRLGREIARRSGWAVLLVDYAKAPEHPFPAGLEDAWTTWQWTVDHAATTLADAGTPLADDYGLVVGGDSSGGNLATVVARRARDAGVRLDGQVLVYPVTDSDFERPSYRAQPEDRSHMEVLWGLYCPQPLWTHPDAAPVRAESLVDLAPALLVRAEDDALNSEIDAYAELLTDAGVAVTRHHMSGVSHGCLSYWGTMPEVSRALDAIAAWLSR